MIKSNNMIDIKNLINEFRNETLLEKEKVFIDGKDKKSVITGSKILTLALTKENIIYTIYHIEVCRDEEGKTVKRCKIHQRKSLGFSIPLSFLVKREFEKAAPETLINALI
ncbi:hypothetical protein [Acinetobacter baumannii]|uniref:hypothetical protein n=1 Tax=Acinetobacter baumannii TaxID=470 RepID=UPI001B31FAE8|nr:hypothetical protein [Acinetobacter baumannii]MBP5807333.1 hypothetical protein [Acinetobacter baumannii]